MIFPCDVTVVIDADTIICASGVHIRLAAINAREKDGTCRHNAPCPDMRHAQAKPIVERMILHRTIQCRQVGTSYRRIVADCTYQGHSVSCGIVATRAAAWWAEYQRRYGMGGCAR